jgi:hypothetical protein
MKNHVYLQLSTYSNAKLSRFLERIFARYVSLEVATTCILSQPCKPESLARGGKKMLAFEAALIPG